MTTHVDRPVEVLYETGHRVEWLFDGAGPYGTITCDLPRESGCHACDDACAHGVVIPVDNVVDGHHDKCLVAEDVNEIGVGYLYCGASRKVQDGSVTIGFDGGDYVWWIEGDDHAALTPDAIIEDIYPEGDVL
jgi:hypothetical protein